LALDHAALARRPLKVTRRICILALSSGAWPFLGQLAIVFARLSRSERSRGGDNGD
jgi:hypothetical protein